MDDTVILCPRPTAPVDGLKHAKRGGVKKTQRRREDVQVCTLIDLYHHFSLAEGPTTHVQQPAGNPAPPAPPVAEIVPPASTSPPDTANTMTTPNEASSASPSHVNITTPNKESTTTPNMASMTTLNKASPTTPNKESEGTPQQSHKRTWVATCKPDDQPTQADTHLTPTQPARKGHGALGALSHGDATGNVNVVRSVRSCERQSSHPQAGKSASMEMGNRYTLDELRERAREFQLELGQRLRDPDGGFLGLADLRAAVRELEVDAASSVPSSRTLASDGGYVARASHGDEEGYGDELSYLVKRVRVGDSVQQPQAFMPYIS
eukprot:comp12855_c0_seq1/m.8020 comp12855_c0_seq1/g.8020  ORF comp12855_c0_seq1/g.8020 comp12855_c0_seq1/m.8020 type:complete len:322 (-) comp12855_c0_seq1:7-972(-)